MQNNCWQMMWQLQIHVSSQFQYIIHRHTSKRVELNFKFRLLALVEKGFSSFREVLSFLLLSFCTLCPLPKLTNPNIPYDKVLNTKRFQVVFYCVYSAIYES